MPYTLYTDICLLDASSSGPSFLPSFTKILPWPKNVLSHRSMSEVQNSYSCHRSLIPAKAAVPSVIGVGLSPSLGMRKGHIIDIEEAIHNIIGTRDAGAWLVFHQYVFVGMGGCTHWAFDVAESSLSRAAKSPSRTSLVCSRQLRLSAFQATVAFCTSSKIVCGRRAEGHQESRRHDRHSFGGGGALLPVKSST